jgi:arylsulfatase A-like enzyme
MRQDTPAIEKQQVLLGKNSIPAVMSICLWFGISAGLAERLLYFFLPRIVGGNDLWYSGVADLLFFSALGFPILVVGHFAWRARIRELAFFFCFAFFALDCLFVVWPPYGHRLGQMAWLSGGALCIAVLATALFVHFPKRFLFFGRLTLPFLAIYALAYLIGAPAWAAYEENRKSAALHAPVGSPNILLIVMDSVGANHLSTYGYGRVTSPHLTELASRGLLFERAVAPSSWTLPSLASTLTGHLPTEHKAGHYHWALGNSFPTVGEVFQRNGYRTAAFSGNTLMFSRRLGFARGYSHFEDGSFVQRLLQTTLGQRIQTRLLRANISHDLVGREGAREISEHALQWIRSGMQPFFVTINYFDAHEPLRPPTAHLRRFSKRDSPLPGQYNWPEDVQLSASDVKDEQDAYDACIAYIDEQISMFLQQLEAESLLKNTIVIVTSDHGQEFQEHGFMFHGKGLYWNLLHVPLIVQWSGHLRSAERISHVAPLQSLPATLLELAGISDSSLPGPSLSRLWTNPELPQDWPSPVSELAKMGPPRFPSHYGAMKSVVTGQWHYIQGGKSGEELYACCDDERRDLSRTMLGSQVATTIRQLLKEAEPLTSERLRTAVAKATRQRNVIQKPQRMAPAETQKDPQRMDELLRALGYVP